MATLRILLIIIFLIAALAVTVIVLLQEGKSAGLGSIGGSTNSGDSYWDKNRKYSLEGKFERWTKITACVFVLSAFALMFIPTSSNSSNTTNNGTSTENVQSSETTDEAKTEDAEKVEATASPEASQTTESAAPSETPAQ